MDTQQASAIDAWHFRLGSGRTQHLHTPEKVGEVYSVAGKILCCHNGLHGSRSAINALHYAPANAGMICRTRHSGVIDIQTDKIASQHRVVVWQADCRAVLHEFACQCAEDIIAIRAAEGLEDVKEQFELAIAAERAFIRHGFRHDRLPAQTARVLSFLPWGSAWAHASCADETYRLLACGVSAALLRRRKGQLRDDPFSLEPHTPAELPLGHDSRAVSTAAMTTRLEALLRAIPHEET